MEEFNHLVGKTADEAEALIREEGYRLRVVNRDGKSCMVTCDYKIDRINVRVVAGIITEIKGRG